MFSPLSDPRAQTSWPIIRDFCPVDLSFTMHTDTQTERRAGDNGDGDTESDEGERKDSDEERLEEDEAEREQDTREDEMRLVPKMRDNEDQSDSQRDKGLQEPRDRMSRGVDVGQRTERTEKKFQLRFSFILRPVFNNSIQFLHCSLQLCGDATETHRDCTHTPAPTHTPAAQQVTHTLYFKVK